MIVDDDMTDVPARRGRRDRLPRPERHVRVLAEPGGHGGGVFVAAGSTPGTSYRADSEGFLYVVDRKKDMIITGVTRLLRNFASFPCCAGVVAPDGSG